MTEDDALTILDELLQTCLDGEQGFRAAADGVKDDHIRRLFSAYADQRAQFAAELRTEIERLGGRPQKSGTVAGSLHRGWMNVRAAVTRGDVGNVLAEAERGEGSAVATYEEAMRAGLPPRIHGLVQHQLDRVREAHDQVRRLGDRAA
jgi:uncharacterized protein (TIGR02284 family)